MPSVNSTIVLGIALVYILLTVGIGIWTRKFAKTTSGFMTGGRDMGIVIIAILLVSEWIGTSATMGTAQLAFKKGLSASWAVTSLFVALVLFAFIMARKYHQAGEYTISGLFEKKYGKTTARLTSLIMIYSLVYVNVVLYVGGAAALGTLLKIPTTTAIFITAFVAGLYVVVGGIKGVAYTNLVHASLKYAGVIITTVVALKLSGGLGHLKAVMPPVYFSWTGGVGYPQILAWFIGNIGAVFCTQYVVQAIASMSDSKKAFKASFLGGVLAIPIGIMTALIGIAAAYVFPKIKPVSSLPQFAVHMNSWLGGVVIASLMGAVFATLSAATLGATALVIRDFYVPLFNPTERSKLLATRFAAILIILLPIPLGMYTHSMVAALFFGRALRTSLSVVAVCLFYLPFFSSGRGVTASLVFSIVGTTVWYAMGNPYHIDNIYVGLFAPIIIMSIDHLLLKATRGKKLAVAVGAEE